MSGGVRVHISQIFGGLDPASYTHHLITNASDSDPAYQLQPFCSEDVTNLPITHGSVLTDILNLKRIQTLFADCNFDIIHGHGAKGGFYARLIGRTKGCPVIYTPHGGNSHDSGRGVQRIIQSTVETLLARAHDTYIFESKYAQKQFVQKFGRHYRNSYINRNGIRIGTVEPNFSSVRKTGHFLIGAFGRLEPAKGFDLLINAVHILLENGFSEVRCSIFGEGESHADLTSLINSLGISDHVTLMGHSTAVSQDMLNCDIIVHPSRLDSMPYVPLEAMRAGKAVIATNVGGLPELITDHYNGLLAKPDPKDIAKHIQSLLQSDQLRTDLAKNGFATVKNEFSENVMLETLDSIYRSLVD